MPSIGYWFSGSAFAAFIAFSATMSTLGYAWYRAAATEQQTTVRKSTVAALNAFYLETDALFRRFLLLPKDISDADYKKLEQAVVDLSNRMDKYVTERFDRAATVSLTDVSADIPKFTEDPAYKSDISKDRATKLYVLASLRKNLSALIARAAVAP
jgi:hypothetical protein